MTKQLSSSLTLLWAIAVPTMWAAFFGIFTIAIFFSERDYYGFVSAGLLKILIPLLLLGGLVLWYFTIMRFKRIDLDADFVYATNYIKTYRYPWHNVQEIKTKKGIFFNKGLINLKQGGNFGTQIPFLLSNRRWKEFVAEDIFGIAQFVEKD
jgi:hypothetical protein